MMTKRKPIQAGHDLVRIKSDEGHLGASIYLDVYKSRPEMKMNIFNDCENITISVSDAEELSAIIMKAFDLLIEGLEE